MTRFLLKQQMIRFNFRKTKNIQSYIKHKRVRDYTMKVVTVMKDQMEMAFMQEGGLKDDGMDIDPVSGNEDTSGFYG